MKKTIFLFLLLYGTVTVSAQRQTVGLRLSYFTGSYRVPPNSDFNRGIWREEIGGLEPALQYRIYWRRVPIYLQTELAYYSRHFEGYKLQPGTGIKRLELKGTQRLVCIPIIVGGQFGRGTLHGFIAAGYHTAIFLQKGWQIARYAGKDGRVRIIGNEQGLLIEGGLRYDLNKHLQIDLGLRYHHAQYSTTTQSTYTTQLNNWVVPRWVAGVAVSWQF